MSGFLTVNKVAGNFHIALGDVAVRGSRHIHAFNPADIATFNVDHKIHQLSFGDQQLNLRDEAPLAKDHHVNKGSGVWQYYIKVVPTVYHTMPQRPDGSWPKSYRYSVNSQFRPALLPNGQRQNLLPGVFFIYDFSPFMITIAPDNRSFLRWITNVCAVLGGVLTVARIVEATLFYSSKALKKK